jgi:16S rRNA (adenine1518-N6/adenine1519-N6)-dimethyltransferase
MPRPQLEQLAHSAGFSLDQRPQELAPATWVQMAAGLNQTRLCADDGVVDG